VSYLPTGFDAIFTAKKGEPFILQSNVATHIVEVTETGAPALFKQVAVFQKEALASKETFNKFYNDANRLATLAGGKYANYRAACDSIGTYSHNLTINEATDTYGSIGHAKEVTRWAFDNKPGKVSNIITVDNNYFFVVAVTGAHKEGLAPVNEVADQIKNQLYSEKYAEKRQGEVAAQIAGMTDLEAIAEKLGTTVSTQSDVAFASMSARSLDPKFVGAIAAAPEGKISGPVAGSYGVYVFKVDGRETGSFYTESDAKNANAQILSYTTQMIVPVMMQDADVKDNRARFF
jgi:peptidyl-prolyl cis-trans isomerase D